VQAVADPVASQVDMYFGNASEMLPYFVSGDKLVEASIEAVNTRSVREKLIRSGIVPGGKTPDQVAEWFKAGKQAFAEAVEMTGLKHE
jgi:hypothetical protein